MVQTTILVERKTRDDLKSLGKKGESYDSIITRLIERYEER